MRANGAEEEALDFHKPEDDVAMHVRLTDLNCCQRQGHRDTVSFDPRHVSESKKIVQVHEYFGSWVRD